MYHSHALRDRSGNMYEIAEALTEHGLQRQRETRRTGAGGLRLGQKKRRRTERRSLRGSSPREKIEILDGACKPRPRLVTRHDIDRDVTTLLKRGLTTTSAGGFFFLPYLLQLGACGPVASLGPTKHEGLPPGAPCLGPRLRVDFRLHGRYPRCRYGEPRRLWSPRRPPFLPSPSTQYRFLQDVPVQESLGLFRALRKRLGGTRPDHARSPRQRRCSQRYIHTLAKR